MATDLASVKAAWAINPKAFDSKPISKAVVPSDSIDEAKTKAIAAIDAQLADLESKGAGAAKKDDLEAAKKIMEGTSES